MHAFGSCAIPVIRSNSHFRASMNECGFIVLNVVCSFPPLSLSHFLSLSLSLSLSLVFDATTDLMVDSTPLHVPLPRYTAAAAEKAPTVTQHHAGSIWEIDNLPLYYTGVGLYCIMVVP